MFMAASDFARKINVGGTWYAQWGKVADGSDSSMVSCYRTAVSVTGEPTAQQCVDAISAEINAETDNKILSGYVWKDTSGTEHSVWLSMENQFNYKAAYDLAVQTGGKTLPVQFKLGSDELPDIVVFSDLDTLASFVTDAMSYVQTTLSDGWERKEAVKNEYGS